MAALTLRAGVPVRRSGAGALPRAQARVAALAPARSPFVVGTSRVVANVAGKTRAASRSAETVICSSRTGLTNSSTTDIYRALDGVTVIRCADGEKVDFTSFLPKDKATGFPAEDLIADPESASYEAIGFLKSVGNTFFNYATPLSFLNRMQSGNMKDIQDVMSRWKPWIPPKQDQALQQGGMLIFDGERCIFEHYDQGTGAHADFDKVIATAVEAASNSA